MRDFGFADIGQLLQATGWTVLLSLLAFVGGGILGAIMTLMRTSRLATLRSFAGGYILLLQGTPLLMQIFLAYFGLGLLGFSVPPVTAAALAFTAYSSAFFA